MRRTIGDMAGAVRSGTLLLATVLGVGVGLLAAPQTGTDTRRALRKRLAAAREDLGEGLEDLESGADPPGRRCARAPRS